MNTRMNIPKTLVVGYQEREDTYTGKLAYVIYKDAKGKLRKENSWQGWRSKDIEPDEYTNEPRSGFVLNRNVGGSRYSHGWDARVEKVRVYDPLGFEFEITIPNLLFILQECTSTKGKGLEGEFVYSWSGKDLVLLPVECEEYKECVKFSASQLGKVTKKDMVEGCTYRMKDMVEVMYLGRHHWFSSQRNFNGMFNTKDLGKKHIFFKLTDRVGNQYCEKNSSNQYIIQTGFTKLATKLTDEPQDEYRDELDNFKHSIYSSQVTDYKVERKVFTIPINTTAYRSEVFVLIPSLNDYVLAKLTENYYYKIDSSTYNSYYRRENHSDKKWVLRSLSKPFKPKFKNGIVNLPNFYRDEANEDNYLTDDEELLKKELYTIFMITDKGARYNILER